MKIKMNRDEIIVALHERDGSFCMYPNCGQRLDFDIQDGPLEVTIDHHYPQSWCFANGWAYEEVWDLSNLKLMHKKCNAKKGDLIPNEDGTLPEKYKKKSLRHRRAERAQRPEVCTACDSGRNLGPDELCAACGSGPMPDRFPQWAKAKANECDHELFWCWACSIGVIERTPAVDVAVRTGESGEWDE